jgi:hypothetical protein
LLVPTHTAPTLLALPMLVRAASPKKVKRVILCV